MVVALKAKFPGPYLKHLAMRFGSVGGTANHVLESAKNFLVLKHHISY